MGGMDGWLVVASRIDIMIMRCERQRTEDRKERVLCGRMGLHRLFLTFQLLMLLCSAVGRTGQRNYIHTQE